MSRSILSGALAAIWLTGTIEPELLRDNSPPATHIVVIDRLKFVPENITVAVGDSVRWINQDIVMHDITEKEKNLWRSKNLNKGESYAIRVETGATYFCTLHPVMQGSISIAK